MRRIMGFRYLVCWEGLDLTDLEREDSGQVDCQEQEPEPEPVGELERARARELGPVPA